MKKTTASKTTKKTKPLVLSEHEKREKLADLAIKEERAKMGKVKRELLEGVLIPQGEMQGIIFNIIQDIQNEVTTAIDGIAKGKAVAVDKIFKKYLS